MLKSCLILAFIALSLDSNGQDTIASQKERISKKLNVHEDNTSAYNPLRGHVVYATVINGDTVPHVMLREFSISSPRIFHNAKEAEKWNKLKRDVKKAYPYAKIASGKLREYNAILATFKTEKERKKFLSVKEKEMKAEFEKDLKNLTLRQGRILIKLIDRETGSTSYELVKELKGTFSAFMWQSIARMFGSSLKDTYEGDGEDKAIEEIVLMLERGDL
jgi:hypothetical protein